MSLHVNGVIALILRFFSPNSISLPANYVTVVEDRSIKNRPIKIKKNFLSDLNHCTPVGNVESTLWGEKMHHFIFVITLSNLSSRPITDDNGGNTSLKLFKRDWSISGMCLVTPCVNFHSIQ